MTFLHKNKKLFTETVLAASEYLGINAFRFCGAL